MRIERDGAAPKLSVAAVVLLASLTGAPAVAAEAVASSATVRNQVECRMTRAALERAAEGALRRLQDPECQQVFADFRDAEGRVLQVKDGKALAGGPCRHEPAIRGRNPSRPALR